MQHLWSAIKQSIIQSGLPDPGCVAQLIGASPIYRKIVGLIPGQDVYRRQPIDVSLSHQCFSFSFSQINRRVLRGGFKKKQTRGLPAFVKWGSYHSDVHAAWDSAASQLRSQGSPIGNGNPCGGKILYWVISDLRKYGVTEPKLGGNVLIFTKKNFLHFLFLKFFHLWFTFSIILISFRCTALWLDNHIFFKVFPLLFPVPNWQHRKCSQQHCNSLNTVLKVGL